MSRTTMPRRTMLRGLAGIGIALPVLDVMLNDGGDALADGTPLPSAYLVCSGGFTLGVDGVSAPNGVTPSVVGPGYDLKAAMTPLGGHGSVKESITVVSSLAIPWGDPMPPGGFGGDNHFHWHMNCFLAGHRVKGPSFDPTMLAPTSDQVVADAIGHDTVFKSLQYLAQPLHYTMVPAPGDFNHGYGSFRDDGSGNMIPVPPATSPKQAYGTLFTGFDPSDPSDAAKKAFEQLERKSVLDLVDRRMGGQIDRLGAADRRRLEQHLEHVREIEALLDHGGPTASNPACEQYPDPGDDPPLGGEVNTHSDYDINKGYSGEEERARRFADLMHMAIICDLTRVGTLMFSMWQSFININPLTGHAIQAHEMQHRGNLTQLNDWIAWHMDHFGYLVAKLRDTPEGAGSVLDRCAIAFINEGGDGPATDPVAPIGSHAPSNMVTLVAGGAGGLRRGEHIVAPAGRNHPANVLITLMGAVGVSGGALGEISGDMPELLA